MPFTFTTCPIEGLFVIEPKVFGDSRGFFLETYSERDFYAAGLTMKFVQDNQSKSTRGVLRGLHFQKKYPQGKLVQALEGEVFDVAVDLRNGSPTFGKYHAVTLSAEKKNQFYIPAGFAHGFLVLSETAVFAYKCTDFYHPEDEGGIRFDSSELAISWPDTGVPAELSVKDSQLPQFSLTDTYYDKQGNWI